jgi:TatD DNase family protein
MVEIDIHTHRPKSDSSIQILNIFAQDLPLPDDENFYSAGLHPWHLDLVDRETCLEAIDWTMNNKNLVAIGECGLDRSIAIDFAVQKWYFRKQIELAEKHAKPLIIHCVRTFPDLIQLKKEFKSNIPWIIHGFQANQPTTLQLIQHNFYFSVGESLLTNQKKKDILKLIPLDHLFLETDDRDVSINTVYGLASQILNLGEEILSDIILDNFKRLFGNSGLK